jgi:hypothetical protein
MKTDAARRCRTCMRKRFGNHARKRSGAKLNGWKRATALLARLGL